MSNDTQTREIDKTTQERFLLEIARQFKAEVGEAIDFDHYHRRLGQHLFIAADRSFRKLREEGKSVVNWKDINMEDFALKAIHTINLGLDAFIPNHVHFIPFKNTKTGKFDILQLPGYKGELYYRLDKAADPPKRVVYELVYKNDKFKAIYSSNGDDYIFEVTEPFKRGEVIGGFGFIAYNDRSKNKLIVVSMEKLLEAKKISKSDAFWTKNEPEMLYKTLVRRICSHIEPDPKKINKSFEVVEKDKYADEISETEEIEYLSNREDFIPDEPKEEKTTTRKPPLPKAKEPEEEEPQCSDAQQRVMTGLIAFLTDKGIDEQELYMDMVTQTGTQVYTEMTVDTADEYIKVLREYQKRFNEGKPIWG